MVPPPLMHALQADERLHSLMHALRADERLRSARRWYGLVVEADTGEWGEQPWLEADTPVEREAAGQLEALMPTLHSLESDPTCSTHSSLRPARTPESPPPTSGGITLQGEVLGRGGMSVVLLGEQSALGRSVAIKTIDDKTGGAERATNVLLREARITGRLEHPNVLPLYDLSMDKGRPQLVLKRIEGRPWSQLMRQPKLVTEKFGASDVLQWNLQVFLQVCNAIRFAHARGIVHRDLKPDNVMVGSFGEVYVLDWGIAVEGGDKGSGSMAGTPAYMAPEMARGEDVDERTDVYLLGALLYELFEGEPPHRGATFPAVVWQALLSQPKISDQVPHDFAEVIRCAMARDPAERYADVDALQRAVLSALEHLDASAMASAALVKLEELEALVEAEEAADVSPAALHELYGQSRFGFEGALGRDGTSSVARDGLRRLHILMTRHSLELGDTATAQGYLARVESPPGELVDAVEAQRKKDAETTARLAALESFRSNLDKGTGRDQRFRFGAVFGAAWIAIALAQQLGGGPEALTHETSLWVSLINSIAIVVLLKVRKQWNRYDRRLLALIALGFFAEFTLDYTLFVMGVSPAQAVVYDFVVRGFMIGAGAIFVDRALTWPSALFGVAAVASAYDTRFVLWWAVVTDVAVVGVLLWRWRPR